MAKFLAIFKQKIELRFSQCLFSYISSPRRIPRERCKEVHCVDLGESFPTSIYLQKSASIQPRTSPSKFEGNYSILFNRLLSGRPRAPAPGSSAVGRSPGSSARRRRPRPCFGESPMRRAGGRRSKARNRSLNSAQYVAETDDRGSLID